MKHPFHINLRSVLMLVVCAGMPDGSQACNVPVFRYAMERWPADPYQIVVYQRPGEQGAAFGLLEKGVKASGRAANYALRDVDVTTPEGKAAAGQHGIAAYPWVEVYYPMHSPVRAPVWSGPLTVDGVRTILESPARSRLAQRLLSGEVAVWVLVRSGNDGKDRRALESLKTHLDRASATLRISETGVDANGNPVGVEDFKSYPVRFGLMEIARGDAKEDLLVNALLKSEPDLARYDEPMAFPVFGRGRALYALVGEGIQEKNIREACQSMLAWCSCEIKAQTPGTDLLIAADWSRPFGGRMVKDPEMPLPSVTTAPAPRVKPAPAASAVPALCERVPAARAASSAVPPEPARRSPLVRNVLYLAGAAGVVLLALSVFLTVRAKR